MPALTRQRKNRRRGNPGRWSCHWWLASVDFYAV